MAWHLQMLFGRVAMSPGLSHLLAADHFENNLPDALRTPGLQLVCTSENLHERADCHLTPCCGCTSASFSPTQMELQGRPADWYWDMPLAKSAPLPLTGHDSLLLACWLCFLQYQCEGAGAGAVTQPLSPTTKESGEGMKRDQPTTGSCSSMVECLASMRRIPGSIPGINKEKK